MRIGVLGVNHKSAELSIRESIARACRQRLCRGQEIASRLCCVVLSTCHRTEVYFSAENLAEAQSALLQLLRETIPFPFEHQMYSYFSHDCFVHLARVTVGLDSVIIAESEIQRQVNVAYQESQRNYSLPSSIHFLFQKCLKIGKEVRSKALLTQGKMGIEKILFLTSQHLFKTIDKVLFIGNSEINRKIITYFQKKGVKVITLCTHSPGLATEMRAQGVQIMPWEYHVYWVQFPLVICASEAHDPFIEMPQGPVHTQLLFDLSVPRNVHAQVARHPHVTLLNMEEVSHILEVYQDHNRSAVQQTEEMVLERVQGYYHAFCARTPFLDSPRCKRDDPKPEGLLSISSERISRYRLEQSTAFHLFQKLNLETRSV